MGTPAHVMRLAGEYVSVREIMNEPSREWLTDVQLRVELSKEKCRETPGAILTGEVCQLCRFYMFFLKSGVMACEFCRTEREWAHDGRTLLQKAMLASKGIYVSPHMRPLELEIIQPDDSDWPMSGGMPL